MQFGITLMGLGSLNAEQIATRDRIVAQIESAGGECTSYSTWADTYQRLSKKDKDAQTLAAAAELSNFFGNRYLACMAAKGQQGVTPAPITPTTVVAPTTIFDAIANTLLPQNAPTVTATGVPVVQSNTGKYLFYGGIALVAIVGGIWLYKRRQRPQAQTGGQK
jgi:hypothetical protein